MENRKSHSKRLDFDLTATKLHGSVKMDDPDAATSDDRQQVEDSPLVSVIMTVYNGERWLELSVRSVIAQTFTDLELIIVDDGSDDGTPEIIARLAAEDNRIHVLRKSNSGIADSLNHGLAAARGEWICRLDADDIALPDRIERQVAIALVDPSTVLVGGDLTIIDADGNAVKNYSYPTAHEQLAKQLINGDRFFAHSSIMFRRDRAIAVGCYRSRITRAEDHDLWMRLAETGRLHGTGSTIVYYRVHETQASYLDGGIRQALDKLIAVTSYHLRRLNQVDPVDESEADFTEFRAIVERCAKSTRFTDVIGFRINLAKHRQMGNISAALASLALTAFTDPALLVRFITGAAGLERTANMAANAWIKQLS